MANQDQGKQQDNQNQQGNQQNQQGNQGGQQQGGGQQKPGQQSQNQPGQQQPGQQKPGQKDQQQQGGRRPASTDLAVPRSPGEGGEPVAAATPFGEHKSAGTAGGAEDGDSHGFCYCPGRKTRSAFERRRCGLAGRQAASRDVSRLALRYNATHRAQSRIVKAPDHFLRVGQDEVLFLHHVVGRKASF